MTRLILITLLILSSAPAYAEWVSFYILPQVDKTLYVDRDTIRRKGDLVKMWFLFDYKTVQTEGGKYLSGKVQYEIDCAEERLQVLAGSYFSGNMGRGNVVDINYAKLKWEPVQPGSFGQDLWEFACKK
jgi:hypothetical protein